MELFIKDRIYIPQLLPQQTKSFMDFNVKREILKKVALTEQDKKDYNIEEDVENRKVTWNAEKDASTPLVVEFTKEELFNKAFDGNGALAYTASYDNPLGHFTYIIFGKKVVQFFNDQLDDINGNKSMLYQDIAKDVFGDEHNVFYCTDANGNLSKPLGEWP